MTIFENIMLVIVAILGFVNGYFIFSQGKKYEDFPMIDILIRSPNGMNNETTCYSENSILITPKEKIGIPIFPNVNIEIRKWSPIVYRLSTITGFSYSIFSKITKKVSFTVPNSEQEFFGRQFIWEDMTTTCSSLKISELVNLEKNLEIMKRYYMKIDMRYYNKFGKKIRWSKGYYIRYQNFYDKGFLSGTYGQMISRMYVSPLELIIK